MGDYFDWGDGGSSILGVVPGEVDSGYWDYGNVSEIPVGSSWAETMPGVEIPTEAAQTSYLDYLPASEAGKSWMDYLPSNKNLLGLAGLGLLGSGILGQKSAASSGNQQALQNWANQLALQRQYYQQDRFPSAEKSAASKASTMANINQSLMTAKQKLSEDYASRGLSGQTLGAGLNNLERTGLTAKANALTQLEEQANTPYYSGSFTVPTIPTAANADYSTSSSLANLGGGLLGMYARGLMGQENDKTNLLTQYLFGNIFGNG